MRWNLLALLLFAPARVPPEMTIAAAEVQDVQATIYSADGCVPCAQFVEAVKKEMPPDGWIIRDDNEADAARAHVIVTKTNTPADKIELFPTTIIRRNGREVDRILGKVTPTKLANAINKHRRN